MTPEHFANQVAEIVRSEALAYAQKIAATAPKMQTPAVVASPPPSASPALPVLGPTAKIQMQHLGTMYTITSTKLSRDSKWLDVRLKTEHGRKCTLRFSWADLFTFSGSPWCNAFGTLMNYVGLERIADSDELVNHRVFLAIGTIVDNTMLAKPEIILAALKGRPG